MKLQNFESLKVWNSEFLRTRNSDEHERDAWVIANVLKSWRFECEILLKYWISRVLHTQNFKVPKFFL